MKSGNETERASMCAGRRSGRMELYIHHTGSKVVSIISSKCGTVPLISLHLDGDITHLYIFRFFFFAATDLTFLSHRWSWPTFVRVSWWNGSDFLENQQHNLCEWGFVSFFMRQFASKRMKKKNQRKKKKRWRNRICFGFLLIFLDDICLVKHTVGWPHRFPEKQNLDIQLWLSAAYQSPSGFEVAAPETFCLLSRVGPRHSNPATLLSCVR